MSCPLPCQRSATRRLAATVCAQPLLCTATRHSCFASPLRSDNPSRLAVRLVLLCADVKVKKGAELTKFKLRLSRYLYTLKVTDQAKADKIAQSFPPGLKKEDIK